jgi:cytochrome b561
MKLPTFKSLEVYDRTTIRLHWATALLVTIQWVVGRITPFLPRGPLRIDIWSMHVLFGFALACVVFARIFWHAAYARILPPADRGALHVLASFSHRLLYALLLAVVALGIINVLAHGFPMFNVWNFPKLGDDAFMQTVNSWHNYVANTIAVVALLHAGAALFHHYVLKDNVLRRMWPELTKRDK